MFGTLIQIRRERASAAPSIRPTRARHLATAAAWRRLFRDRPMIPLLVSLGALVVDQRVRPAGAWLPQWVGTVRFRGAVPLAILAGCQTLAMLTGGIDLSVGAVASMTGFVLATLVGGPGLAAGLAIALLIGRTGRSRDRYRRRCLPGPPADHDAGYEPGRARARQRVADRHRTRSARGARSLRTLGSGTLLGVIPYSFVVSAPVAATQSARAAAERLRPAPLRGRRQPDRGAAFGRPQRGRS